MGNVNTIPVVSQAKSLVQVVTGDPDGAAETQEKFFHECIGVSQVGGIHHLVGDHEGGNKAIVSATRTTGVMVGGATGFLVGGPVGAVAGGIAAGATLDGAATLGSSLRENEYKPEGLFASVQEVIDRPSGGAVFDAVAVPVFDGLAGYQGGKIAGALENAAAAKAANAPLDPQTAAKAAEVRVYADRAMAIAEDMRETPGVTTGQLLKQYDVAMALDKKATLIENAGRPPPPVFDPKASSRPNVYPPGVQEDDRQRKKFRNSQQQYQRTQETTSTSTSTSTSTPTSEAPTSSTFNFSANGELTFHKELQKVITAFKSFDSLNTYDLSVIESKVNQFLRGKGAQVIQTEKIFTKVMLNESENQNFKSEHVVSVLYGKTIAEKFEKKNPLRGFQVLLRHQSESMGALHILLSHPQDMLDILPGLDISLFPPHIRQFLENDLDNLRNGKQRRLLTEAQKLAMVEEAKQYYIKNPWNRRKMIANELILVAYLRVHMNPANFFAHQFFPVSSNRQQFRVVFNMSTTSGNVRQLSICLSCDQGGTGKAIIYKSPGKDGVDCDCYEIVTSFLLC
ncbi:hypothetical protein CRE_01018 [Caenorhabditis remanei]|uniref:Uncharacterized protein n=1 Tax=Caenorhabditis remanei TaxID=31234 RepID=E3MIE3_CAERE|nr:hypothetical protein CRE_01018 [Caenorhabditis remanei]